MYNIADKISLTVLKLKILSVVITFVNKAKKKSKAL